MKPTQGKSSRDDAPQMAALQGPLTGFGHWRDGSPMPGVPVPELLDDLA